MPYDETLRKVVETLKKTITAAPAMSSMKIRPGMTKAGRVAVSLTPDPVRGPRPGRIPATPTES